MRRADLSLIAEARHRQVMELTIAPAFPEPYLQPNPKEDCGYYTAAYIARCLGNPDVTAAQVKAWRAETRRHEAYYARHVLGAEFRTFWDVYKDEPERKIFWLGPQARDWVRDWLNDGWIAAVNLHRVPEMGHAAAVLDCADEGVLLHDPIYGHVLEAWDWFLGPGARLEGEPRDPQRRCHFVEGWYRAPRRP
jgi:hypothetical protein